MMMPRIPTTTTTTTTDSICQRTSRDSLTNDTHHTRRVGYSCRCYCLLLLLTTSVVVLGTTTSATTTMSVVTAFQSSAIVHNHHHQEQQQQRRQGYHCYYHVGNDGQCRRVRRLLAATNNKDESIDNDDNDEQEKEEQLTLGIPILLNPITSEDVAAIKAEANEVVNDIVAAGIDELQVLRQKMQYDNQIMQQQREIQREMDLSLAQQTLLNKIDTLTQDFLQQTKSSRETTKLLSQADQSNTDEYGTSTTGVEMGIWGRVNGRYVSTTTTSTGSSNTEDGLLGSARSRKDDSNENNANKKQQQQQLRMIVIADPTSDPFAKLLCTPLQESLQKVLSSTSSASFEMIMYKPSSTIPIGNTCDAQAILIFCTSINDVTTLQTILDRIYRTTISSSSSNGVVQKPPSQIIAISTIGTSRTDKMPYSLQNMMSNNKLSKRKQMEDYIIKFVQQQRTGIDYTICLLGNEIKVDSNNEKFQLVYGDTIVDGGGKVINIQTAVSVLTHTIALQPYARNTTFSCTGSILTKSSSTTNNNNNNKNSVVDVDAILDEAFIVLDGPELLRFEQLPTTTTRSTSSNGNDDTDRTFNTVTEYITEWAELLASTNQGLTTPVRLEIGTESSKYGLLPFNVLQQSKPIRLVFQPTNTGKYYSSKKDDERIQKDRNDITSNKSQSSPSSLPIRNSVTAKEGGIEFVVEKVISNDYNPNNTNDNNPSTSSIRVRAKRCNYSTDATIKELSEETILSQFKKCMNVWIKDHS